MSGETEDAVSGWTTDTLKAHYDTVLEQQAKAVDAALAAAEKAVDKAEEANTKRFESVNEFRAQLRDQQALFLGRDEALARFNALDQKVTAVTGRLDKLDGMDTGSLEVRRMMLAVTAILVTGMGVAVAVIAVLLK